MIDVEPDPVSEEFAPYVIEEGLHREGMPEAPPGVLGVPFHGWTVMAIGERVTVDGGEIQACKVITSKCERLSWRSWTSVRCRNDDYRYPGIHQSEDQARRFLNGEYLSERTGS